MEDRVFRNAMGKFATGITIVSMHDDHEIKAMTVNAFMSISLNPKLIAVSIDKNASMHDKLMNADKFGVSILSDDQKEVSMVYAKQMKKEKEIPFINMDEAPVIESSLVTLACEVNKKVSAGDHTIFIAEVTDMNIRSADPLLFFEGKYREIHS